MSPPLHIIDARKPIATKGNRLKGKGAPRRQARYWWMGGGADVFLVFVARAGVENSQHYDNATIEFMGIANIHKMRESLDALKCQQKCRL